MIAIPLIICIRNTVAWQNIDQGSLVYPPGIWINPERDIEYGKRVWRHRTKADYCKTRNELKRIALANWCEIPELTMLVDMTTINVGEFTKSIANLFDDYLLLPTDDDDWYSPQIYTYLRQHLDQECIRWPGMRYNTVNNGFLHKITDTRNDRYPESNTYALTKRGIESISQADQEIILKNHCRFHEVCENAQIEPLFVDHPLSLYNLHGASISYLVNCKTAPFEKQMMPDLPVQLEWARPYINELNQVLNGLVRDDAVRLL